MRGRLVTIGLLIVTLFLSINLVRSILDMSQRGSILTDAERRLLEEKDKQEELSRKLVQVESNDYIEREARDKLNLSKEGEMVVILPPITPPASPTPVVVYSPFEAWWRVFW